MARAPRPLSDSDRDAWLHFTRHVTPLGGRPPPPERPVAPAPSRPARPAPAPGAAGGPPPALVIGERGLGIDDSSWRALSRGRLAPSRRLDLHGRSASAALAELRAFLLLASADGLRCVEIITGRSTGERSERGETGVLRRELPHWLNRPELRSLIVAAQHPRANVGAVRLILRRRARSADQSRGVQLRDACTK